MPGPGSSYKIAATHGLYLTNEKLVTVNGNLPNQNTRLWGGDATNDGMIDISDLTSHRLPTLAPTNPIPVLVVAADINAELDHQHPGPRPGRRQLQQDQGCSRLR